MIYLLNQNNDILMAMGNSKGIVIRIYQRQSTQRSILSKDMSSTTRENPYG